jgi:hypothetical protein
LQKTEIVTLILFKHNFVAFCVKLVPRKKHIFKTVSFFVQIVVMRRLRKKRKKNQEEGEKEKELVFFMASKKKHAVSQQKEELSQDDFSFTKVNYKFLFVRHGF